jgi:uncharacterized metal-binding protein YceD (DUF177 family)
MDNPLVFDISEIASKPQGTTTVYTLNDPVEFDDPEVKTVGNMKGEVTIMTIDREFNVQIRDIEVDVECECSKCLEKFTQKVQIPFAEKQYVIDKRNREEREEVGYVDTKYQTIDTTELFRQEIILHFPLIPVCSTSCNGITQG